MKIRQKLLLVVLGGVVGTLAVTIFALMRMGAVAIGSPRHQLMLLHQNLLADALPPPLFLVETHLTFMELEKSLDGKEAIADRDQLVAHLKELRDAHVQACSRWDSALASDTLHRIVSEACSESKHLDRLIEDTLLPAVASGDKEKIRISGAGIDRIYDRNSQAIRKLEPIINAHVENDVQESSRQTHLAYLASLAGALLVGAAVGCFGNRLTLGIARSTKNIAKGLDAFANGDLTTSITGIDSSLELQRISISYETARVKLQETFGHFQDETAQLGSMTVQLKGSSSILSDQSRNSQEQARQVSDQTVIVDKVMSEIAARTSDSSRQFQDTSNSIQELSQTIGHIARKAESTRSITQRAKDSTHAARARMDDLTLGAGEIEKILSVIQDIAEQTKLLALNATIEASRAGEAGKGFAVVASEVKQLAKQTAEATDTVGKTIADLRSGTTAASDEILRIQSVVDEVDDVVASIAQAVEQQNGSTQHIALNMVAATSDIEAVARRLEDAASSTQRIARTTLALTGTGTEVGTRAAEIADAAATLASTSHRIHGDLAKWETHD